MSDTPVEFVAFEKLYGGDAAGHTDSSGTVVPDNKVDATDVNAVVSAYPSETGDANYNVLADFDGDGSIGLIEFALASKNSGISIDLDHEGVALAGGLGEGQILARAIAVNNEKVIAWLSVESEHGGEYTYSIQAEAVASLRAYAVAISINSDEWELVSWSDQLFASNRTESFQKKSGYDHIFVGAMRGLGAVVQKDVELMSFTLQQKVENASRPTLTSVGMVDNSVNFSQAIIGEVDLGLPMEFSLAQNFPNPFNPETTISFSLPQAGRVKLAVYNLLGREVRSLVANTMEAGSYKLVWNSLDNNGRTVSSGLYFYRLVVDRKIIATKKMILLR
ncbi:MAG: T9SS type A sorting domain-containing protein [Candidatus Marinimicrobia bacterium]|nr:T9SS type A sorting domain-containing protein [Candidatus Neomarinimicrobiota bacterium]